MRNKNHVISDSHFGHTNVIKHESRPFSSVDEMDEYMIERWNSVVRPNDIVYHLGDFAFRIPVEHMTEIFNRLNGKKRLIRGNHDLSPSVYHKMGWDEVYDVIHERKFGVDLTLTHRPFGDDRGPVDHGQLCIHGHCHSKVERFRDRMFNASVEMNNYTPVDLEWVIHQMRNK